jgi:hypothetical protein
MQRTGKQMAFGRARNVVGPLRRANDSDSNIRDSDDDNDSDRNHHAPARMIAAGAGTSFT